MEGAPAAAELLVGNKEALAQRGGSDGWVDWGEAGLSGEGNFSRVSVGLLKCAQSRGGETAKAKELWWNSGIPFYSGAEERDFEQHEDRE